MNLSLHFIGHFPGEPGSVMFIEAKDDAGGGTVVVTTGLLEL